MINIVLDSVSFSIHKLHDHRKKHPCARDNEKPLTRATGRPTILPSYFSLAAEYGLGDEDEMHFVDSSATTQTVQEEYQSYILGGLSDPTVDILAFWEVSCLMVT